MGTAERTDPFLSYRFIVEIEGLVVGGFSDVSGLDVEIQTEEYREGGNNDFVHQLPVNTSYSRIVLKRGMTDASTLWKWQNDAGNGRTVPTTVHIILLDGVGKQILAWRCIDAYPVKWSGPELQASGSNVAMETIELVHCGIRKD